MASEGELVGDGGVTVSGARVLRLRDDPSELVMGGIETTLTGVEGEGVVAAGVGASGDPGVGATGDGVAVSPPPMVTVAAEVVHL